MKLLINPTYLIRILSIYSALQLGGCLGGGTVGTGVTSLGNHGPSYSERGVKFILETTLKDLSGKILSNAHIKIDSSHGTFLCVTNKSGMCELPVTLASGEELKISVVNGKNRYGGSQQVSPAGKERISRILFVAPNGTAQFSDE